MALGDLIASRFSSQSSYSSSLVSYHLDVVDRDAAAPDVGCHAPMTTSMAYLPQTILFCDFRHEGFEYSVPLGPSENGPVAKWKPKDRMKTGCVALVLCLNISVDPPDVIKISPCARMECWIDPFSMSSQKALDIIGQALHEQYEKWQPRARYKISLDPTVEEVKKLCTTCRKYAKSERGLFHYNGHGVPKPTASGEIWVYNKSYTQYIPLPIRELDLWMKSPSIYVFDCSAAGLIVSAFLEHLDLSSSEATVQSSKDCILLAACEAHETLPESPEFPADIFTACLTTPIKMALRWFCSHSFLLDTLDPSLIDKIPGRQNDRKTLLGELNWIFTAITDTIAWNVLPHDLFQRLFRQDLLVASLFRNFLLAERIMRSANCSPVSYPILPPTHQHHMWNAWDMAAEICLSKLPQLIDNPSTEFQSSPFFTEQLKAFEVWLDHGSEHKKPPEQLPIVLQVLLSQSHRFRALALLGRFLDIGPWAVDLALSVGIFPYVLKLLQTTATELRSILVFIWTKILALDKSCQVDLVKDGGHRYFIKFLDSTEAFPEQRAMAAFVLAVIVDGHRQGQEACIQENLIDVCLRYLQLANPHDAQTEPLTTEPLLLQWLCLCLGKLWEEFLEAQGIGLQADAPAVFAPLLLEPQPEVRAASVFALGTLLDIGNDSFKEDLGDEDCGGDDKIKGDFNIIKSLLQVVGDGSPLVRVEVAVALARFAFAHNKHLKAIAAAYWKPQATTILNQTSSLANISSRNGCYSSPTQYMQPGSTLPFPIGPVLRVGSDGAAVGRDGKASTSSPLASTGILHGSPLSDDSSQTSYPGEVINENSSNGVIACSRFKSMDNSTYLQCVLAISNLAKDPSPRIASLGQKILSIIGIEQEVVTKSTRINAGSGSQGDQSAPSSKFTGLARSSSWFDMSAGHLLMTFRTPPVSPQRESYLTGLRRVCSLEFRPHQLITSDAGLADPLLNSGVYAVPERSLLPLSCIYNWSCCHFSRPLLMASDDNGQMTARREERERYALDHIARCQHTSGSRLGSNQIASWDTKFETGTRAMLLMPFSPVVVGADDNERIRVWNYEEATIWNSFNNHDLTERGISKLCLLNELDDCLLLVASYDGNVRIWKDFTQKGKQKLVTAFSSIQVKPGVRSMNTVIDWQQQSGYMYASGDIPSILIWDLDKELLVGTISTPLSSRTSALSASQVHGSQFAAGFADGSVRLYDIRTSDMLVCTATPHNPRSERVVGIGFQPGLDPSKIVSASQAGDIQFLDIRKHTESCRPINAHKGSLTALAVHRHAPVIASGSAKQIVRVFSLEGQPLSAIKYYPTFVGQRIGPVSCVAFHPYRVLLAAGAADPCVSIYADENDKSR